MLKLIDAFKPERYQELKEIFAAMRGSPAQRNT
jgi:hypothetical protein